MASYTITKEFNFTDIVGQMSGNNYGTSAYYLNSFDPAINNYVYPNTFIGSWRYSSESIATGEFTYTRCVYNGYQNDFSWIALQEQLTDNIQVELGFSDVGESTFVHAIDLFTNTTTVGSKSRYRVTLTNVQTSSWNGYANIQSASVGIEVESFDASGASTLIGYTPIPFFNFFSKRLIVKVVGDDIYIGTGAISSSTDPYMNAILSQGFSEKITVLGGINRSNRSIAVSCKGYSSAQFSTAMGGLGYLKVHSLLPQSDGITIYNYRSFWTNLKVSTEVSA